MIQLLALTTFASAAGVAVYAITATVAPRFDRIAAALRGKPLSFPLTPPREPCARATPRSHAPRDSLTPAPSRRGRSPSQQVTGA
jgi:hypothetical protein